MNSYIKEHNFSGHPLLEMYSHGYKALLLPSAGSNLIDLEDTVNHIHFFNYDQDIPYDVYTKYPLFFGLPTLYLPNRIKNGILKTSDSEYTLPINEPMRNNFIHGFAHKRCYSVIDKVKTDEFVSVKTQFKYTSNDEFYKYFNVSFNICLTFTLSKTGLKYDFQIENCSDKMLPVGTGTHTTIKCPFINNGKSRNYLIQAPVKSRILLDEYCIPNSTSNHLSDFDKHLINGTLNPCKHGFNDDFFILDQNNNKEYFEVKVQNPNKKIEIVNELDKKYKYFILWNFDPKSGFFCPEPLSWIIDAPNTKLTNLNSGYTEISPGKTFSIYQKFYTKTLL